VRAACRDPEGGAPMSAPDLQQGVEGYAALVRRYHRTLDLVSDAGLRELPRHIADGQRYARLIERVAGPSATVVDVGSGVGLPGVVIALALPRAQGFLVERRRRRTAFLELAAAQLGLANVTVVGDDVRAVEGVCADVVTAQAVADLATIVELTRHLHADPCYVLSRRAEGGPGSLAAVWRAGGLVGDGQTGAEGLPAGAEVLEEPLEPRGSLVAVRLPGGSACQSSA